MKTYMFEEMMADHLWEGGRYGNTVVYLGHVGQSYFLYDLDAGELMVGEKPNKTVRLIEVEDYENILSSVVDCDMREHPQMTDYANQAYEAISDTVDELRALTDFLWSE